MTDALRLLDNGYWPIPFIGKRPNQDLKWKEYETRRPSEEEVSRWLRQYPDGNWGIVLQEVICIDIDILDEADAHRVKTLALKTLGGNPPERIGKYPKTGLFYRVEGAVEGDVLKDIVLGKDKAVEFRTGAGKVMACFGMHPKTRKPYYWPEESILDIPVEDLPVATEMNLKILRTRIGREFPAAQRTAGTGFKAVDPDRVRDPGTELITDGREAFLRDKVYSAFQDVKDWHKPEAVAEEAWKRFAGAADLSIPHEDGGRLYDAGDWYRKKCFEKAKAIIGKFPRGPQRRELTPWPEEVSVEEADKKLSIVLDNFFTLKRDDEGNAQRLLVAGSAGLGKSRQMLDRVLKEVEWRPQLEPVIRFKTWIVSPSFKLGYELAERFDGKAQVIRGRTHEVAVSPDSQSGGTLCERPDAVEAATRAGVRNIEGTLCHRVIKDPETGEKTEEFCPHYDDCAYNGQFLTDADVYFMPHDYLFLEIREDRLPPPDLVVIEEDIIGTMVKMAAGVAPEEIIESAGYISGKNNPKTTPEDRRRAAELIVDGLRAGEDPRTALLAADFGPEWVKNAADDAAPMVFLSPSMDEKQIIRAAGRVPRAHASRIFGRIASEMELDRPGLRSIYMDTRPAKTEEGENGPVELVFTQYRRGLTSKITEGVPVLILDATAEPDLLQAAFPGLETVEIHAKRNMHVTQTYGFSASKGQLTPHEGDGKSSEKAIRRAESLRAEISATLFRMAAKGIGPGLMITHKDAEEFIELPPGWKSEHFGNLRGIDAYKDLPAVVIVGRPQAQARDVVRIARALLYDRETELNLDPEPGYLKTKTKLRRHPDKLVEPHYFEDPFLEAVRRSITEAEIIQGADRIRMVHRTDRAAVFLINEVPTFPEDRTVSYRALVGRKGDRGAGGGPEVRFAEAYERSGGVLELSPPWLSKSFPDLFATPNSAKIALRRVRDFKRGLFSINTIIENRPLLNPEKTPKVSADNGEPGPTAATSEIKRFPSSIRAALDPLSEEPTVTDGYFYRKEGQRRATRVASHRDPGTVRKVLERRHGPLAEFVIPPEFITEHAAGGGDNVEPFLPKPPQPALPSYLRDVKPVTLLKPAVMAPKARDGPG
jgi:hypothetical protein